VRVTWIWAFVPTQIVLEPLTLAVGLRVTVALPVALPVQVASISEETE
jgi:hypothetical protein